MGEEDTTVAYVFSFNNKMNDIPYRIEKNGAKWSCTCAAFTYSGGKTCKHIRTMREEKKAGTLKINEHYKITEFGEKVLKL